MFGESKRFPFGFATFHGVLFIGTGRDGLPYIN